MLAISRLIAEEVDGEWNLKELTDGNFTRRGYSGLMTESNEWGSLKKKESNKS